MLSTEYNASLHQSVTLHCRAEGNPQPKFMWSPCDPRENVCNESTLIIPKVLNDGVYTCKVTNKLGSDSANTNVGKLTLNKILQWRSVYSTKVLIILLTEIEAIRILSFISLLDLQGQDYKFDIHYKYKTLIQTNLNELTSTIVI